jgi:hypothetical protein
MAEDKPDLGHLAWALDQPFGIQRTLLELYGFVRANAAAPARAPRPRL